MSSNENNQPSLLSGHAEYVKGATEVRIPIIRLEYFDCTTS